MAFKYCVLGHMVAEEGITCYYPNTVCVCGGGGSPGAHLMAEEYVAVTSSPLRGICNIKL